MSTQDKADNELDDLFRKSLEEPNIPFDPQAWQAMEKKLDKFHSDRVAYWISFFGLLALLLITTLVVWHQNAGQPGPQEVTIEQYNKTIQPDHEKADGKERVATDENNVNRVIPGRTPSSANADKTVDEKPDITEKTPQPDKNTNRETALVEQKKLNLKKGKGLKSETDTMDNERRLILGEVGNHRQAMLPKKTTAYAREGTAKKKESESYTAKTRRPGSASKERTDPSSAKKLNRKTAPRPVFATNRLTKRKNLASRKLAKNQENALEDNETSANKKTNNLVPYSTGTNENTAAFTNKEEQSSVTKLSSRPYQLVPAKVSVPELPLQLLPAPIPAATIVQPADSVPLAKRRKQPLSRNLSLNLMLAPDLSTVGFKNFTTPGTNIGLAVEYELSKRVGISLGALYSTKIYYAAGKDYTPMKPWPWGPPDQIQGNCKVIDLPINIRYNTLITKQYNLYLSTGISSYLMQKEDYSYAYKGYPSVSWEAPTRNQHWLSVANVSVGYEFKLGSQVSFQVEPFVKIPLAGVGAGKVKLSSTGAFFTLKYYLHK